jgi:hypothetical protein
VTSIGSMKAPSIWDAANDARRFNAVINPVARNLRGATREGQGSHKKTPRFAGLFEAAEGARTLDLLHGKQTL